MLKDIEYRVIADKMEGNGGISRESYRVGIRSNYFMDERIIILQSNYIVKDNSIW